MKLLSPAPGRRTSLLSIVAFSAQAVERHDPAPDPIKEGGNPPPVIVRLTPEQEAEILKGVDSPTMAISGYIKTSMMRSPGRKGVHGHPAGHPRSFLPA